MAAADQDSRSRTSSDFVDDTILEAFVPAASQVNVQELLETWDGEILEDKNTIVPFIEQRQFLLLDEEVPVHVVLRTRLLDEKTLEAFLARLAITLEARAYGTLHVKPGENEKPSPVNELLFQGAIDQGEEPTICATEVQREGHEGPIQYLYIFWKITVPISRPKSKINKLSVYFTPIASLKPVENTKLVAVDDEYLTSGVLQPINLLAPLAGDPALKGVKPKLLISGMYRNPTTPAVSELQRKLRSGSRRLFRSAPAFLWRLRFTNSPAITERRATIVSLDLEITPFAGSDVCLEHVRLDLQKGKVETMCSPLPMQCKPGDQVTLLYKLWPGSKEDLSSLGGNLPTLNVEIAGTVLVSEMCIPKIRFTWATPIELPSTRPSSRAGANRDPPKPLGPDSFVTPPEQYTANDTTAITNGVVISITGPPKVTVGKHFTWELFVINRSEKMQRLAFTAVPKRRPWAKHRQKDSGSSIQTSEQPDSSTKKSLAEPVLDERLIYIEQRNAVQEPTSLICLSPDVRTGPLAPGACFMTEMKFVALAVGVLNLEALRVVNLTSQTQDTVDVRDLPDIYVVE
ncbi:uncharacterized protein PV09_07347 [Verruconis gallopava]|uniref:Trafficking protein particle complex II-specific subunit 65 IgD3 domain-containing protein n=1 Tax=Verruconis gallopava TaxID=253628 RepID=A0A0D1XGI1_9PEZI|nr:uncharacterized protein PV09_07347 [Verruconis gallopava]KIW01311.1 hypothetical protein PV09_07347 [Verruconis gallopava]